jgi:ATP-dependent phosphoenolpyruvate carboxykinase
MFVLALSISLVGCYKEKAVDLPMEKEPIVEEVVKDNSDMKNIVHDKYKIDVVDNSDNIINLDSRNSTMVQKYSEAIKLVKDFCIDNSLEIIFVEPI